MTTQTTATARLIKILALAASTMAIGNPRECEAITITAARIAARAGLDLLPFADAAGVSLLCTIPWTEEKAPGGSYSIGPTVQCEDGSSMIVHEALDGSGVWIERMAGEAGDFRYLSRGYWRDCEITEAVFFAREAWGC